MEKNPFSLPDEHWQCKSCKKDWFEDHAESCPYCESKDIGKMSKIKTYANWKGDLKDYLQIGDIVDQEMVDYFLEVLPPAYWRATIIQMGEPYSHVEGKPTYATLHGVNGHWTYAGHCHIGKTSEPSSGVVGE